VAIVRSVGSLQAVQTMTGTVRGDPTWATSYAAPWGCSADPATYACLYQSQPNVRTVVDFLARNIAQLGIHVFRRVSDTDRERLADHQLADWLTHPTPFCTRYRLIETLLQDLGIYFNAYWLKLREGDRIGLQRLPAEQMTVAGGLVPSTFLWTTPSGYRYELPPSEVVHFGGYNPFDPLTGLSPLETLRRLLAEDAAAMDHRESFWRNAARIEGVVERPAAAKTWTPEQVESFRSQWRAKFGGAAGVGTVPVLQDGAHFQPIAFTPRQAEYTAARKLTREEVAAAYHIPLPMVGILDHATFSNIREQHKQLYQDSLGPWLVMIAEEFERQLLPECRDRDRVYVEFNIAEKLTGSFEEQAASLQTLVGAPIMTRNEGRSRLNLPAIAEPGADALVRPLNTTAAGGETEAPRTPFVDEEAAIAIQPVIERAWDRQAAVIAKALPEHRAAAFDRERWDRELVADLVPLYRAAGVDERQAYQRAKHVAHVVNSDTHTLLGSGVPAFAPQHRKANAYAP
jgi:HK97 family phage portal protein